MREALVLSLLLCCAPRPQDGAERAQLCHWQHRADYHEFSCNEAHSSSYVRDQLLKYAFPNAAIRIRLNSTRTSVLSSDLFAGFNVISFKCSYCDIHKIPFDAMNSFGPNVTVLDISRSYIGTISRHRVKLLQFKNTLETISLQFGNNISRIESFAFSAYSNLEDLAISENVRIGTIEDYAFADVPKLKKLMLRNCNVTSLPVNAFRNLPTLETLRIEKNHISSLDNGIFDSKSLKNLTSLYLHGNPWNCNCSLQWLKDYINENKAVIAGEPECFRPISADFKTAEFCQNSGSRSSFVIRVTIVSVTAAVSVLTI